MLKYPLLLLITLGLVFSLVGCSLPTTPAPKPSCDTASLQQVTSVDPQEL